MQLVTETSDLTIVVEPDPEPTYIDLDAAATTSSSPEVLQAVQGFLPWYSSVHRGAGLKSRVSTARYEDARQAVLDFVGADARTHVAVFTRNTTEAINVIAARLRLSEDDVVVTSAVEHHANLLPWRRHATLRVVECEEDGTFGLDAVVEALDQSPAPKVLAITGASNVTGWLPDLRPIAAAAHARGVLVVVDGAQLVPHRQVDMADLGIDVLAFSGHKMQAPFGSGALVAPSHLLADGEPFLVGGGAVDAVSVEDVVWTSGPDREEAGTPNLIGAVALAAAAEQLSSNWDEVIRHERELVSLIDAELATVPGLRRLGPVVPDRLPVAAFVVDGLPDGLVAARLAQEFDIGVRNGCFCAHPYMAALLSLTTEQVEQFHSDVRVGLRQRLPGAVRVSAGPTTSAADIAVLGQALRTIAATPETSAQYVIDDHGDYHRP